MQVVSVVDHGIKKAVDDSMTQQEKVMLSIMHFYRGDRDIYQTLDDFAGQASLKGSVVYQALYRLAGKGQIEILKERQENGREKVIGVRLNKAPEPEKIVANSVEKARTNPKIVRRTEAKVTSQLVHLSQYMGKKIAITKAQDILLEAGLDPVDVAQAFNNLFEENPIAEEAIALYKELNDTLKEKTDLQLMVESNRRVREANGTTSSDD